MWCLNHAVALPQPTSERTEGHRPPRHRPTGDVLSNLPLSSKPSSNKHLLVKLVFCQKEGCFETNEDTHQIKSSQNKKRERKKMKKSTSPTTLHIPAQRETSQAVRFSLISNQAKHLQLRTAFLSFSEGSRTRPAACGTLTAHPVGGFTASCPHQGFPAPVYSLLELLETHQACKPTETGTADF